MSKYTENLIEYLEQGYSLPTIFSSIDDFDDMFVGHYCDSELGYETPELFEIKLDIKANLVVPLYASRISSYNSILTNLGIPNKTITTNHTDSNTGSGSVSHTGTISNSGSDAHTGSDAIAHTGTVGRSGSATAGAQTRKHTELPVDSSTAEPSSKDVIDTYTNTDSSTDTYNNTDTTTHGLTITRGNTETFNNTDTNSSTNSSSGSNTQTFTGLDVNEQLALVKFYENKILNLKQLLLEEFKPLFMQIY